MNLSRRALLKGVAGLAGAAVLDPVEPVKRIWALGGIPEPKVVPSAEDWFKFHIREDPRWIRALEVEPDLPFLDYLRHAERWPEAVHKPIVLGPPPEIVPAAWVGWDRPEGPRLVYGEEAWSIVTGRDVAPLLKGRADG